jgi:SWI/SNF related-matrix-associated actin-dependent regulator of chromatin subfamily C
MSSAPPPAPTRAKSAVVNLAECEDPAVIARYGPIAASIARKPEDVLGFASADATPRALSILSSHLRVFLDASLGRASNLACRPLVKFPQRLFSHYEPEGALEIMLSTCLRFKASSGQRRFDLLNADKHRLYLDMAAMIAKNLTRAHLLPEVRIYITLHVPKEEHSALHAHVAALHAKVVDDAEQATHIIYNDPEGCSPEETDGTDYCRTLTLAPPHALVHWWYHPDSYDSWIPLADVQGDPELEAKNVGPWFVGVRWLIDSAFFNEWTNELDYEIPDELRRPFPGSECIFAARSSSRISGGSNRNRKKKRKSGGGSSQSNRDLPAPSEAGALASAAVGTGSIDEDAESAAAAAARKASKKRKRADSKTESRDRPKDRDERNDRDRERERERDRRRERDRERARERSAHERLVAGADAEPATGASERRDSGTNSPRRADERHKRARTDASLDGDTGDVAVGGRRKVETGDSVSSPLDVDSEQPSNGGSFKVRVKMPTENKGDGMEIDGGNEGTGCDNRDGDAVDDNPSNSNPARVGPGDGGRDRDRKWDRDRDRDRSGRRSKSSKKKERRKNRHDSIALQQDGISCMKDADPIPEAEVRRIRNISMDIPEAITGTPPSDRIVFDVNESEASGESDEPRRLEAGPPSYRATAVPGDAIVSGKEAGTPVTAADLIESLPQMPVRIPAQSRWFRMDAIHDLERRSLPEFFNDRSPSKTPKVYKVYRDFMIDTWRLTPSKYLTATSARRHLAGDVCAILRVHSFLEHWGLINFGVDPDTRPHNAVMKSIRPESWNAAPIIDQPSHTNAANAAVETGVPRLLLFDEAPTCRRSVPPISLKSAVDASKGKNSADVQLATRREVYAAAAAIKYECDACGEDCSRMRYHCVGQADLDLCPTCFANGRYPITLSARDFEQLATVANSEAYDGSVWSEAEVLLLLEGLEQFGDDWNAVSAHVGTKNNEQCVMQFLRMPIEDSFLGDQIGKWGKGGEKGAAALAASGEHLFASAPLPFADTSNPVMAQVAFLASSVSPEVAAAAAQAALTKIMSETNNANPEAPTSDFKHERSQLAGQLMANGSGQHQQQQSRMPGPELDAAAVQASAAVGLAAAAARARKLADSEVREIERVFAVVVETKLRIIEEKMKSFAELENTIRAERDKLERQRQVMYADRVSAALARAGGPEADLAVFADGGSGVPAVGGPTALSSMQQTQSSRPTQQAPSVQPIQPLQHQMQPVVGQVQLQPMQSIQPAHQPINGQPLQLHPQQPTNLSMNGPSRLQ